MKFIFIILAFFLAQVSKGQSKTVLTHIPYTSYTTYSAYQSTKKKFPDIRIVEDSVSTAVIERKNTAFCSTGNGNLVLDVFSPAAVSRKKRPAIVIIHGGGWRSGSRSQ